MLVVEDEMLVRMFVVELLAELGYRTVEAGSGEEALALLESGAPPPAAMLVDVGLPGLRGDVLALRARARFPGLAILIASGQGEAELRRAFAGQEGIAFLAKPYDAVDLRRALARLPIAPPAPDRL